MISAFKRLVHTNGQTSGDKANDKRLSSGNYQPMELSLQKKFSKGVQYNMKIIIRGDKNVGKTCLFLRLQGEKFKEDYIPTEEIQVANIEWNYNVTDDRVKVEIWDVIDKGKKRKQNTSELKLNEKNSNKSNQIPSDQDNELSLDAEFIDVYKNTNGVILVFDLTKQWSFEYCQREIKNIPKNIPVLICGNHRDQGHHGLPINEDKVKSFIETIERESSGQIRYAETSMSNGFGLKYIYKFFNLPFLHLKKQSLIKQLEINDREIDCCCQELTLLEESDDQNYERFLYTIQNRRREFADKLSQIPKINLAGASNNNLNLKDITKPIPSIIIGANNPLEIPKNYSNNIKSPKVSKSMSTPNNLNDNNVTKFNNNNDKKLNLENETEELRQFLEDAIEAQNELNKQPQIEIQDESDDDDEIDKPKILSYQDELDEEDQIEGQPSSILEENNLKKIDKISNDKLDKDDNKLIIENKLSIEEYDRKHSNDNQKKINKKNKPIINLVDELPNKSILNEEKSQSTKTKKKKSKKSSSNDKINKKKEKNIEDLLGPNLVTPLDDYQTNNDDYLEL